jgi:hypothetical protein
MLERDLIIEKRFVADSVGCKESIVPNLEFYQSSFYLWNIVHRGVRRSMDKFIELLLRSFGFNTPIEAASFASHYGVLFSRILRLRSGHRLIRDPVNYQIVLGQSIANSVGQARNDYLIPRSKLQVSLLIAVG